MVTLYKDEDYLAVYKQRRKLWWIVVSVTAVYVGLCVALVVYHGSLPYASPKQTLPKWLAGILSVAYVIFAYPFLAIKYHRVRKYYKLLGYLSTGLKSEETNYFYCFDKDKLQQDNLDVVSCVFETWNKKKQEWMEREAYADPELPLPPFESGDYVHYISQSNFVIEYEILQKKALEFEEVNEDGENVVEERIEEMQKGEEI